MGLFNSISDFLSGGNQSKAEYAANRAVDNLEALQTPDVTEMRLYLEGLVQQGQITPEEAQVYMQEASSAEDITTDPKLKQAQLDALASLQEIGENGMTAMDRAKLSKIAGQEASADRGRRDQIISNAYERGVGGSGLEVLASLKSGQDASTRQAERDLDVEAMAQERALQALQAGGKLGGEIQSQDFNQELAKSQAKDAINAFNTSNRNQIGLANTGFKNAAQEKNLAERQRVADANVNTRNAQQQYNKQLPQQDFENKYKKAGGVAQGYNAVADQYNNSGRNVTNLIGTGIQAGATASDEDVKENIEEFNAEDFLNKLVPSTFNYKDPKYGEGKQVGVMAQDIEKGAPQMVSEDAEGVKRVDYSKAAGPLFASLASLNDRINKLEKK
jgi:hypothetical protein